MSITYGAPGVYVENVPSSQRPIEAVGTSTAAFIGTVADDVTMPAAPDGGDAPAVSAEGGVKLLLRWDDFAQNFGTFGPGNATLAHAVFGFFINGGGRCYVTRVKDAKTLDNPASSLDLLKTYDDISIVAIPGAVTGTQHQALIAHAAAMQDRVAVLDAPVPAKPDYTKIATIRPAAPSSQGAYAGLYYPNVITAGPDPSGALTPVPPSGHVAGIYSRSDATRGVWKAPANEAVVGAVDLSARLGTEEQEILNPAGVNVIRLIGGSVTVWGARTLSNATDFRYVSTSRYLCFLRDSLIAGTRWVVFEPNGIPLWKKIIRNVSDFLLTQWQEGALFGSTPEKAFFVRCDESTNPPASRELGRVVVEVGVAIVRPAEFVIFRIQQTSGE